MSLAFERKVPLVLTFVFFMLTTIGVFWYRGTISLQDEIEHQRHTREVLTRLDGLLMQAGINESALLGFVITGNETYLEPTTRGERLIAEDINQLRSLLSDHPQQLTALNDLYSLIQDRARFINEMAARRRTDGFDSTVGSLAQGRSLGFASQIRSAVDAIKLRELEIQQEREQNLDTNMNRTVMILIVSSLAGVVALVLANLLVVFEMGKRRDAERALRKSNEELEQRIGDRTHEIQKANNDLLEAAAERERLLSAEQSARREAEIANRLRDEFMATVSHELRTPLNSILGWARLMNSGTLDARQSTKAIRTIIKNSESQNRLIEDLLDAARMISGKLELEMTDVPVSEFVTNSIETARPAAAAGGVTLDLCMDEQTAGKIVRGDRLRLEQVMSNLLNNAVKFTPRGGRINVSASGDGDHIEIAVADTGKGISPEFLPQVFERFRQDISARKKGGSLGLGLAVVRNLTEMHGGTVSAFSEGENRGATFTVRLPVAGR